MPFPTLLPIGQPRLGIAQRLLLDLVFFLQLLQPRLGIVHRFAQHHQLGLIATDVLAQIGQRLLRWFGAVIKRIPLASIIYDSAKKLLDMLEDLDDVQDVFSNADLGADAYA